jgi:ribosomal protein S6
MQVLADPSSASSYAQDPEVAKAIEKVKEFLKNNTWGPLRRAWRALKALKKEPWKSLERAWKEKGKDFLKNNTWRVQTYLLTGTKVLTYADVCWRMRSYADVRSTNVLAYWYKRALTEPWESLQRALKEKVKEFLKNNTWGVQAYLLTGTKVLAYWYKITTKMRPRRLKKSRSSLRTTLKAP